MGRDVSKQAMFSVPPHLILFGYSFITFITLIAVTSQFSFRCA
jgi:hypothetical protein